MGSDRRVGDRRAGEAGWLRWSPAAAIAVVAVVDLALGQDVVLGLVVVAPLLAANLAGPAVTAGYGILALVTAALLGVGDGAYEPGTPLAAQLFRLGMILVMSAAAVVTAGYRVRRARRFTQVVKVAEVAQRAILLPVPEWVGPLRIGVHYESAASEALIGGDLYGMVQTPYGLRILVGDVRGKGLDAVRMSVQVLAAFRERANDHPDPGVLMDHVDRAVARCAEDEEDFVTAVLAQITDTGRVTLITAGHPAPYALTRARVRTLDPAADGTARPPLGLGGLRPLTGPAATALDLAGGDRLLLYTDGLTEARHPDTGVFLPPQTIVAALAADRDVPGALAALRDDVLAHAGGQLHDDIALVMIEYRPDDPPGPAATSAGVERSQDMLPSPA